MSINQQLQSTNKYPLTITRHLPTGLNFIQLSVHTLPIEIDLRPEMPPVYDQGVINSCSANAICTAIQYLDKSFDPSRLFLYYNERYLENKVIVSPV